MDWYDGRSNTLSIYLFRSDRVVSFEATLSVSTAALPLTAPLDGYATRPRQSVFVPNMARCGICFKEKSTPWMSFSFPRAGRVVQHTHAPEDLLSESSMFGCRPATDICWPKQRWDNQPRVVKHLTLTE